MRCKRENLDMDLEPTFYPGEMNVCIFCSMRNMEITIILSVLSSVDNCVQTFQLVCLSFYFSISIITVSHVIYIFFDERLCLKA